MKAAIVGIGLMGGSLGLALQKTNIFDEVLGYDHNGRHEKEAISLGLVHRLIDFEELKNCDCIFLAIPVQGIIEFLQNIDGLKKDATIIDLGSTKELIINNIPSKIRTNFVAAHPMTGTEKSGPTAAEAKLYENKIVVLCDLEHSGDKQQKLAVEVFEKIGMNLVFMDSKNHDIHACYMSHLPHAISFALANTVMNQEDPKAIVTLAAGGFRDMSRVAKSSPQMWTDIFKQNKENLLYSICQFEKELSNAKTMIEKEDWKGLEAWMSNATTLHKIL